MLTAALRDQADLELQLLMRMGEERRRTLRYWHLSSNNSKIITAMGIPICIIGGIFRSLRMSWS